MVGDPSLQPRACCRGLHLEGPPTPHAGIRSIAHHRGCCSCWPRRGTAPAWARSPASAGARSSSRGHGSTWKGHQGWLGGSRERSAPLSRRPGPLPPPGLRPQPSRPQAALAGPLLTSPWGPPASGSRPGRSSSRSRCTAAPTSPSSSRSSPQTGAGSHQPGPLRAGAALRSPSAPSLRSPPILVRPLSGCPVPPNIMNAHQ